MVNDEWSDDGLDDAVIPDPEDPGEDAINAMFDAVQQNYTIHKDLIAYMDMLDSLKYWSVTRLSRVAAVMGSDDSDVQAHYAGILPPRVVLPMIHPIQVGLTHLAKIVQHCAMHMSAVNNDWVTFKRSYLASQPTGVEPTDAEITAAYDWYKTNDFQVDCVQPIYQEMVDLVPS